VKAIRERVDRVLCLLPFEPPIFQQAGIDARFVGHPVLESGADRGDAMRFRTRWQVAASERVLLVMPGSRRAEARRLLPLFGASLRLLCQRVPGLRPAVAVSPVVAAQVRGAMRDWPGSPILAEDLASRHDAFAAAADGGAGLIKSGTSSLEMAVAGVPHVVAYRLNPVTAWIAERLVRVRHASLVNLLAERAVVPEFLQRFATPDALATALAALLTDPRTAAAQRSGFAAVLDQLRLEGLAPSAAAAEAVSDLLPPG
jgi:lipid-A-disaccharide synthase